jgi:hypothetical protein
MHIPKITLLKKHTHMGQRHNMYAVELLTTHVGDRQTMGTTLHQPVATSTA